MFTCPNSSGVAMVQNAEVHSIQGLNDFWVDLEVPRHWEHFDSRAKLSLLDTKRGSLMQVSPLPDPLVVALAGELRSAVRNSADAALFRSVAPTIELMELDVGEVHGYYFS